jgi:hypothetical protein
MLVARGRFAPPSHCLRVLLCRPQANFWLRFWCSTMWRGKNQLPGLVALASLVTLVAVCVGFFGYTTITWPPQRRAVAELLPKGFEFTTRLDSRNGAGPTVEDELRKRGAHVVEGRIVNRDGRPITFYTRSHIGPYVGFGKESDRHDAEQEAEIEELIKEFDVIICHFYYI